MPLYALCFGTADGPKCFPYNLGARKPQFGKPGNAGGMTVRAVCRRVS